MDYVEKKASSVEKAIDLALKELGIQREEAEIEIITEGKLLTKAVVRVSKREVVEEKQEETVKNKEKPQKAGKKQQNKEEARARALAFVEGLLSAMKVDATATVCDDEDDIKIVISGADTSTVIGYRGEALDAVQYLTLLTANKGESGFVRVVVDAENYREKRKVVLAGLAERLADKADRLGRRIELEPMNPFERRAIHASLADSDKVTTESHGDEPNRYVVIVPNNETPGAKPEKYTGHKDARRDRGGRTRRNSGRVQSRPSHSDNYKPKTSGYDPYAPSEEYKEKPTSSFSKTGPGKLRSFGYKKR